MYSLPPEVQLDVLKCLNFNQLAFVKQTNFYFKNLINKCQNILARVKFKKLEIIDINSPYSSSLKHKIIEPKSGIFEINLNNRLKKKWQAAIDESVPLFLHDFGFGRDFVIRIVDKERYILKFPNIPKNLKELIIIRFWLKQLFECVFERACFKKIVFNPEMINLLFDNDKTIPLQFHIQKPFISIDNNIIKDIFKFADNYLAVSETLSIFDNGSSEKHTNILFNILKNEGKKIPKIRFFGLRTTRLHDLFVNYITTSTEVNSSRIVAAIDYHYNSLNNFELNEKAENVEIDLLNYIYYTKYQLTNIHNPEVRFSFCYEAMKDDTIYLIQIRKMKEE